MAISGPGRDQLRELADRLKFLGEDGQGLRKELLNELGKAGESLAREIADPERLKSYMPNRYAETLGDDLAVSTQKILGGNSPRVSIVAKGRAHHRKVAIVELGFLNHPVFARGIRRRPRFMSAEDLASKLGVPIHMARGWTWVNGQTAGMKPGFFADPCDAAAPDVRDHVLRAMDETARKITDGR